MQALAHTTSYLGSSSRISILLHGHARLLRLKELTITLHARSL